MRLRVLFFLAFFGSAALRPCRATTLVRLSLEQLSQASTHVVRGHAVRQESRWNPEHTRIVTLTTVAVFLPIAFLTGIAGSFFRPFALTVVVALLASLVVAVTVVPLLASHLLPPLHAPLSSRPTRP